MFVSIYVLTVRIQDYQNLPCNASKQPSSVRLDRHPEYRATLSGTRCRPTDHAGQLDYGDKVVERQCCTVV